MACCLENAARASIPATATTARRTTTTARATTPGLARCSTVAAGRPATAAVGSRATEARRAISTPQAATSAAIDPLVVQRLRDFARDGDIEEDRTVAAEGLSDALGELVGLGDAVGFDAEGSG